MITTKFCTRHDSNACAKMCSDLIAMTGIAMKWVLHHIMMMKTCYKQWHVFLFFTFECSFGLLRETSGSFTISLGGFLTLKKSHHIDDSAPRQTFLSNRKSIAPVYWVIFTHLYGEIRQFPYQDKKCLLIIYGGGLLYWDFTNEFPLKFKFERNFVSP